MTADNPAPQPKLVSLELRPWGRGSRYVATLDNGEEVYLSRCTTILGKLAKPALYAWNARLASEYWLKAMMQFSLQLPDGPTPELVAQFNQFHQDAQAHPDRESTEAKEIGSSVHRAIECKLTTGAFPGWMNHAGLCRWFRDKCSWSSEEKAAAMADQTLHAVECWDMWFSTSGLTPRNVELQVAHPELGYAGTTDGLFYDSGGRVVLPDWKTSAGIYPEMFWQCAAYALAAHRQGHPLPDVGLVVQIPKDLTQPSCRVAVAWDNPGRLRELVKGWRHHVEAQRLLPTEAQVKKAVLV